MVFTDLKSPVMDGPEAIARIRQMEGGKHIAIVVVSAAASMPNLRDIAVLLTRRERYFKDAPVGCNSSGKPAMN